MASDQTDLVKLTIFTLNSILQNNTIKSVFATFTDFKKALDTVDKDMLLYKLLISNIKGKLYDALKSIYVHTTSCMHINEKYTDWFSYKSGVKQGDWISPAIFSILVPDLGADLNGVKISLPLYADDILFVVKTETGMQKMPDSLHACCNK